MSFLRFLNSFPYDSDLWRRVIAALEKLVVALIFVGIHYGLDAIITPLFSKWPTAEHVASIALPAAFLAIILILLFEMVWIMVPRKSKRRRTTKKKIKTKNGDKDEKA